MWLRFWNWCRDAEGWQVLAGVVYLIICVFDFVIVPTWIGLTRVEASEIIRVMDDAMDASVQIAVIDALMYQHQPFTLKGGGLFHLAFGALLTGSAITSKG